MKKELNLLRKELFFTGMKKSLIDNFFVIFAIPCVVITLLLVLLWYHMGGFPLVLGIWVSIASLVVVPIVFSLFSASRERLTLKLKAETEKAKGFVGVDRMRSESDSLLFWSWLPPLSWSWLPPLSWSWLPRSSMLREYMNNLYAFVFIGVVLISIGWIFTMFNNFISREDTLSLVLGFWVSITSPVVACIVFRLFSARRRLKAETKKAKGPVGVDEMGSESGPPLSFLKKAIFAMLSPFLNAFWIRATVIWYVLIVCYFIIRLDILSMTLNVGAFLILIFVAYIVFRLFSARRED